MALAAVAKHPMIAYGKGAGTGQGLHGLEQSIEELMRERLERATASIPDDVPVEPVLVSGEPASALAEIATADGGLLMLGSRAYGPLRRVLLGSVATELARTAPCPVIVHPRPRKPAA